jgi:hypothetical protein
MVINFIYFFVSDAEKHKIFDKAIEMYQNYFKISDYYL